MILLVSSKLTDLGSQGTPLDSIVVCRERPLAAVKPTLTSKTLHSLNSFATSSRMENVSFLLCFERNKYQTQQLDRIKCGHLSLMFLNKEN